MESINSIEGLTSALKDWKDIEESINNYITSVWLDDKSNSQAQKVLKAAGYHVFPVKVIKDRLMSKLWREVDNFPKDRIPELFELAKKYHEPYFNSIYERKIIEPEVPFIMVTMNSHCGCIKINFFWGEGLTEYTSAYVSKFKQFYKEYIKLFK